MLVFFLFRCDRPENCKQTAATKNVHNSRKMAGNFKSPLRSLLKDSRSDFFNDFRLDIGLSSALAMSTKKGEKI